MSVLSLSGSNSKSAAVYNSCHAAPTDSGILRAQCLPLGEGHRYGNTAREFRSARYRTKHALFLRCFLCRTPYAAPRVQPPKVKLILGIYLGAANGRLPLNKSLISLRASSGRLGSVVAFSFARVSSICFCNWAKSRDTSVGCHTAPGSQNT